jgi:hypothetical protein
MRPDIVFCERQTMPSFITESANAVGSSSVAIFCNATLFSRYKAVQKKKEKGIH